MKLKHLLEETKALTGYAYFFDMSGNGCDLDDSHEISLDVYSKKTDATNAHKRLHRIADGSDYEHKMITSNGVIGPKVYASLGYDWKGAKMMEDLIFLGQSTDNPDIVVKRLKKNPDALEMIDIAAEVDDVEHIVHFVSYLKL